jgi:hypothetical protein
MQRGHADAAHTDDAARELVARSHILLVSAHRTENVPGQNGGGHDAGSRLLEK